MKKIWIVIAVAIALSACKKPSTSGNDKIMMADATLSEPPTTQELKAAPSGPKGYSSNGSNDINIETKIVKEGEIRFKTEDLNNTRKALYASLKKLGGYVAEESEDNDIDDAQNVITLHARIPAKSFDIFLAEISADAESVDSKSVRITDVTTQFIDVITQLENKKKLEQRYLELLKKSDKISDLVEIEGKLSEIQSSIESAQGQLNYLNKQVDYSSLDITFYSRQTVTRGESYAHKIKVAIVDGWRILGRMFFGFIARWPIWIILFGLFYVSRRWVIKNRKPRN